MQHTTPRIHTQNVDIESRRYYIENMKLFFLRNQRPMTIRKFSYNFKKTVKPTE